MAQIHAVPMHPAIGLTVKDERTAEQDEQVQRSAGIKYCSGIKVSHHLHQNQAAFQHVSQIAQTSFFWQLQDFPLPCNFSMHPAMEYAKRHLIIAVVGQMRALLIFFPLSCTPPSLL